MKPEYAEALRKTARNFRMFLPLLLGVMLLIPLVITIIPPSLYGQVFTGNQLADSLIGAGIGSVVTGNPINSYIIGGEFVNQGVSLAAVTAFIIAWITVGVIQFPAESLMLGRRFALARNILGFVFAAAIGILTAMILGCVS